MTGPAPGSSAEAVLRARLGIPAAAQRVLVFGETSHWDPNWLYTSDNAYGQQWLRDNGMSVEPRLVYLPDDRSGPD